MTDVKRQKNYLILKKPRVTEKATFISSHPDPVYTFEVDQEANKIQIKQAVVERFKVTPIKIRIINLPAKTRRRRGTAGARSGIKKALVYLKAGQTIDVI